MNAVTLRKPEATETANHGCSTGQVLFIRGILPRSGTNFLADALNHHPQIVRSPGRFWEFAPFRFQEQLDNYLHCIERSKHADQFSAESFLPHLGDAWLSYLAGRIQADQWAVYKEPSIDRLSSMFQMFSGSRALIIQRDGRDIVSSALKAEFGLPQFQWWKRSHWRRMLPDEAFRIHCRRYRDAAENLMQFLGSDEGRTFRSRYLLVKYEDLLRDPQQWIPKIMEWLSLDADRFDWEGFSSMPVRGSSFLRSRDGGHDFACGIEKPADGFDPTRRWSDWSPRRMRYYDSVAGDLARQLGYQ
ncbi:sulfotransferase [Roseiconus nitratireducens]|uniref:Sulfotransferase n=1 Tax=Roseiconus nitratireducens TaxID=2605748 RepID=A0A5M6DCL4_9BACT|nr:sulfotransferase [Roseiconus nitratireducens]KAA5543819.1 sulfotransferase [Roseiconus nitratireducens]